MQKCIIIFSVLLLSSCSNRQEIAILTGSHPSPTIQFAANELADLLGDIYPDTRFAIHSRNRSRGTSIRLSTKIASHNSNIQFPKQLGGAFSITNDGKVAVIAGYDEPGVLQGVYHLLEKLGYDFQLTQLISPQPKETFNFDAWNLSDFPLQQERIVFNWHNFLSGCSVWDLEDWKKWILHSARLGFNTIMIHTYGNNPIHSFTHEGVEKPSGYLATSTSGRDWGTEHVNDTRRLIGGELFDQAVFGSQAALVQDSMRIAAARSLMQEVFLYAHMMGLKIHFAFDMDTRSANPQEILSKLPEHAQLKTAEGYFLANPETKEGYAFYRSQIMALLNDYPQIDRLVIWTRKYNAKPPWLTPVRSLTPDQFPETWKLDYNAMIEQTPKMAQDPYSPSSFVIGKIIHAYEKIIAESGMDVELGSGSWEFGFLPAAHHFFPESVSLYPLDFKVLFNTDTVREELLITGSERTTIPILWAHHDDHRYMGKPYTPFESFQEKLEESGSSGFGIIHWLTRPLDLYFKSLSRQVWNSTINEDLIDFNRLTTKKIFPQGSSLFEEFLNDWIINAPMFGRETSDYFMDPGSFIIGETPSDPDSLIASIGYRIKLLENLNSQSLNTEAKKVVGYYLGLEYFYQSFIQQQSILCHSNRTWMEGRYTEALELIKNCSPEHTIEAFSKIYSQVEPTRGELAMIISLNLRWYPDFINQKQLSRLEPIRYNFQPTSHDSLAQAPGTFTFFVDRNGMFWKGYGVEEIGYIQAITLKTVAEETEDQYILSNTPFSLNLQTWRGQPLSPGKYRLIIYSLETIHDSITLHINGPNITEYNLIRSPENNELAVDFSSSGGAIQFSLDPQGKELKLTCLELIPLP